MEAARVVRLHRAWRIPAYREQAANDMGVCLDVQIAHLGKVYRLLALVGITLARAVKIWRDIALAFVNHLWGVHMLGL